jgi:hypothetical protein
MSTNYFNTFIAASADCKAVNGTEPAKADTIAGRQYRLIADHPYGHTSDDVLFEVFSLRNAVPEDGKVAAREAFFARSQACLRASPLVKQFGWGIHHDANGKVALYGVETEAYRGFLKDKRLTIVHGMRSSRR